MDTSRGGKGPPPRTQVGEAYLRRVQGGWHHPKEPSRLRLRGCIPVNAKEHVYRICHKYNPWAYHSPILSLRPYIIHRNVGWWQESPLQLQCGGGTWRYHLETQRVHQIFSGSKRAGYRYPDCLHRVQNCHGKFTLPWRLSVLEGTGEKILDGLPGPLHWSPIRPMRAT